MCRTTRGFVLLCVLASLAACSPALAQVRIRTFIPGNYLGGNTHRVVVENTGRRPALLTGWLLATRDYSLRFPSGLSLQPGQQLALGKLPRPSYPVDLVLTQQKDFLIKMYSRSVEGNYVALLRPDGSMADGFYHAQLRTVPFLPARDTLFLLNGTPIPYTLPSEADPAWGYFPVGTDPAIGFEQVAGTWRITSATPGQVVYAPAGYQALEARFANGIMTIKWRTAFEDNLRHHILERGTDPAQLAPIHQEPGKGGPQQIASYTYLDDRVQRDTLYYYRLRAVSNAGEEVLSKVIEAQASPVPVPFRLQVSPEGPSPAAEVRIRFASAYTQPVRIELLDADTYEQVAQLYASPVFAGTEHLLALTEAVPPGRYLLLATAGGQRYWRRLVLR